MPLQVRRPFAVFALAFSCALLAGLAENVSEALQGLRRQPYVLVFMDCPMPEIDGFEATALICAQDSGVLDRDVPIVAMTAKGMKGDRERCLDAGMNDYVAKPIQRDAVAAALARWLSAAPGEGEAPRAAA